jgi:hypothetical protein
MPIVEVVVVPVPIVEGVVVKVVPVPNVVDGGSVAGK